MDSQTPSRPRAAARINAMGRITTKPRSMDTAKDRPGCETELKNAAVTTLTPAKRNPAK